MVSYKLTSLHKDLILFNCKIARPHTGFAGGILRKLQEKVPIETSNSARSKELHQKHNLTNVDVMKQKMPSIYNQSNFNTPSFNVQKEGSL